MSEDVALERVEAFEEKYPRQVFKLACYAAFPLIITPDLLYQIWANFMVKQVSWVAVAHILLSSLCEESGYESYEMELEIRNILLSHLSESELKALGYFMLQYIEKRLVNADSLTQNLKERQRITALAYVEPSQAAKALGQKLKLSQGMTSESIKEAYRWTSFTETLAEPLKKAGFEPLLTYNDLIIDVAFEETNTAAYKEKFALFRKQEEKLKQSLKLPNPPKSSDFSPSLSSDLLNYISPQERKTFEVKVSVIVFENEEEETEDIAKEESYETVFVDKTGEIVNRQTCQAWYYDERLFEESNEEQTEETEDIFLSEVEEETEETEDILSFEAEDSLKSAIRMIYIPEGQFWMGSPDTEKDRYSDESPQHWVNVPSFYMSQTAITQKQWRFVANLPQEQRELKSDPAEDGDDYPVRYVSWYDAIEFCARLSRYTRRDYRLPTEAEWEYACRCAPRQKAKGKRQKEGDNVGGQDLSSKSSLTLNEGGNSDDDVGAQGLRPSQGLRPNGQQLTLEEWNDNYHQPFHFGETITSKLARYNSSVTYQQESSAENPSQPAPVKSFPPNAFGLYEMHGNVWEWCLDPWHGSYEENDQPAPNDGSVWDEGNENENLYQNLLDNINVLLNGSRRHVLRGGSFVNDPRDCRSAYRSYDDPDVDSSFNGFRVVCAPR